MTNLKWFGLVLALPVFLLAPVADAQTVKCTITSFSAVPASVAPGQSATLNIKTANCDKANLLGLNPNNPSESLKVSANGSVSSGALSSSRAFTLQASKGTATPVTQTLTVNTTSVAEAPTATEEEGGFWHWIGNVLSSVGSSVGNAIDAVF